MTPPTVFISYSWDSEAHKEWVLNLAENLIKNGVDVLLDQYELSAGKEMTFFMEKAMTADKVLLILTPNYKLKADKREGGVGYEYSLLSKEYYDKEPDKTRILPVLREGDEKISSPAYVQTRIFHDMREDSKFDSRFFEVIKLIINKPLIKKPPLGKLPKFDDDSIPEIEKTILDYKEKEEFSVKRFAIINSHSGTDLFLDELQIIIDQISKSLDNYKSNFGFQFMTKTTPKPRNSILFSTMNFTFFVGYENLYENTASDVLLNLNFFKGLVGFEEYYSPRIEAEVVYRKNYKFDLDENFKPIFIKDDNKDEKFTSHEIATIALREVIVNEIKLRESKLR